MHLTQSKQELFDNQHQLILMHFTKLVKIDGLRSVSMAKLAKELAISTKTLYRHFPTKSALVQTVVESTGQQFNDKRSQRIIKGVNPHQRIETAALEWFDLRSELGERFLNDIKRDFPDIFYLHIKYMNSFLNQSATNLGPDIRSGLNKEYALSLLWQMINKLPLHEECEALGITRKQALSEAIDIWAHGCLRMYNK